VAVPGGPLLPEGRGEVRIGGLKASKSLVLIVCAGLLGALVFDVVGLRMIARAMGWGGSAPKGLAKPGVKLGKRFLTKRVFYEDKDLDLVDDIAFGDLDPKPGLEVGIAGGTRALFCDETGKVKAVTTFPEHWGTMEIVELDGDNACEFIPRKFATPALLDHEGKCLWKYDEDGADVMCAGDINGDCSPEFTVGFAGDGGVHLLDRNGKLVWRQPDGNIWCLATADVCADGALEIVHCNSRGELVTRDATGKVLSRVQPYIPGASLIFPFYVGDFALCRWPRSADRESVVLSPNGVIALVDYRGRVTSRFRSPRLSDEMDVQAATVRFHQDQPEYLATVGFVDAWGKSTLFVFDREQKLVYHETLPGMCDSLAVMPLGKTGAEALLVGGEGKVWEYTAPTTTSSR
jgi:hypothetical protein